MRINKTCEMCGAAFVAAQENYKYCSEKCRSKAKNEQTRAWKDEHKEYLKQERKLRQTKGYVKKQKKCAVCGKILPHARQVTCLDCLLRQSLGANKEQRSKARKLLRLRGFDKMAILQEAEERGIK